MASCNQGKRVCGAPVRLGGALAVGAVLACLGGAGEALAQSGEVPDLQGIVVVPEETCNDLRDLTTGTPAAGSDGDVILACDAGDDGQRGQCQLISGGGAEPEVNAGQGIGFCADRFPDGVRVIEEGEAVLKDNVDIVASAFGSIIGTTDDGVAVDTYCDSSSDTGGVKECREVRDDGDFTSTCGSGLIVTPATFAANAEGCGIVEDIFESSVLGPNDDSLAFAVFIDVDRIGQAGSETLFVCPGRNLVCPSAPLGQQNVTVEYLLQKVLIQEDPDCFRFQGRRICV